MPQTDYNPNDEPEDILLVLGDGKLGYCQTSVDHTQKQPFSQVNLTMFFEARERFAQKRPNEYVRGLLSQYGNHGKPIQLNRPTHVDHQQALAFRQRELEEMRLAKESTRKVPRS